VRHRISNSDCEIRLFTVKKYLYKCDLRFHLGEDLDYAIWVMAPRSFLGGYNVSVENSASIFGVLV
jgi:hypothetical protein